MKMHNIAAIIVAAGRGERAGQSHEGPKQFRRIGDHAVIRHTIEAFLAHPAIDRLVVALHPDDRELFAQAVPERDARVLLVDGGPSRQSSTRLALRALGDRPPDFVLVHDGVRPFVDGELIARVVEGLSSEAGSLPSLAVSDTLKAIDHRGMVGSTVPRDGLYAAQTPQGFPYRLLHDAHERAAAAGHDHFTDDSAIAEWAGIAVRIVQGSPDNVKITWARDIHLADIRMKAQSMHFPDIRTGNGYDVHAFEDGDAVVLCGVSIPHTQKLCGHSDADVGLHALTDALLATCAAGDIGTHFPPSDPQWKGAASRLFVEHAARLVRQRGGRIANADVTLICEAPRIGPHRGAMTTALAQMLSISHDRISIKATTNEKLGFVGRREGIAAIATATVIFPGDVPE